MVLHRILQRDDVQRVAGQVAEHIGHGGGLAGAGGAHQQHHAAGVFQQSVVVVQVAALQPEDGLVQHLGGLVQQAKDDLLTVDGGHGGDTQVKAVAPDGEHGVAVLGYLVLGNIHAAHDLQAGDDGVLQVGGHSEHTLQQTVNTHTHQHFTLLGLQMDVAGALGEGALDQGVDKADGGGRGLRVGGVPGHLGGDDVLAGTGLALHLLDDAGGALAAIQALDGLLYRLAGGDHGDDAFAGGGLDLVLGHKVQGVVHGQVQTVLHQFYRDHEKLFGQVPGDVFGQLHGNGHGGQVHEVHAQLHTQRVNELRFGDNPLPDENIAQTLTVLAGQGQGLLQLLAGDDTGGDQKIAQPHICHGIHLQTVKSKKIK